MLNPDPAYLIGSAPCSNSVFISNSWPYLAAIWREVFPFLSQASISAPKNKMETHLKFIPLMLKIFHSIYNQYNNASQKYTKTYI